MAEKQDPQAGYPANPSQGYPVNQGYPANQGPAEGYQPPIQGYPVNQGYPANQGPEGYLNRPGPLIPSGQQYRDQCK
jgi:hypothetical protein